MHAKFGEAQTQLLNLFVGLNNMNSKRTLFLSLLTLGSITLGGCYADFGFIQIGTKEETNNNTNNQANNNSAPINEEDQKHINEYYSSINTNAEGTTLLNALKTLNLSKRNSTVGYNAMGTSSTGKYKFTDYDPATVKYTSSGQPYGVKILSFYSGKSTTTFNREHVWPVSRGGDKVEDDIFMTRPTITEENSVRGNSCYVTGMNTEFDGWDPVTAFASGVGNYSNIRGECARIVFYCLTAADGLVINDNTSNSKNNMGKITDLVKWACENPVNDRERRRNNGGEFLQGNRNAFVDHPEYVCKIWGNTNSTTKKACGIK